MNNANLSNMLKWGVEHSQASEASQDANVSRTQITQADLLALFNSGEIRSDADLMRESMAAVRDETIGLDNRVQAFENLEELIANLDNANNMEPLGLWTPLVEQLDSNEADLREFAASCCSTAVQNNIKTQERLLIVGAIPTLTRMATTDVERKVRKKAINALSSATRNFQASLDAAILHMPPEFKPEGQLDANDMESVDILINKLRASL